MRKTLHEFVIEQLRDGSSVSWNDGAEDSLKYAKLTNRAPKLGDFIPCWRGKIVKEPSVCTEDVKRYEFAKSRVIFKGDWELIEQEKDWIQIRSKELKLDIEWSGNECDVTLWGYNWGARDYLPANRIEDLPREIEFKDGVV